MTLYGYGLAAGWDVARGSVTNIETQLAPYVQPRPLAPRTQPREFHPVRETTLALRERGDGLSVVRWEFRAMPVSALKYLFDTYLSSGAVVSAKVTVLHRQHVLSATYELLNCWMVRPLVGQEYTYGQHLCRDVLLRFNVVATVAEE